MLHLILVSVPHKNLCVDSEAEWFDLSHNRSGNIHLSARKIAELRQKVWRVQKH